MHKAGSADAGATQAALERAGAQVTLLASSGADHITELLENSAIERLVVLGGDGMIHHAAQTAATINLPMGIIPGGTGNDIARALRIPRRCLDAAELAIGPTSSIDLIRVDDGERHAFAVSVLTAGFSGHVTDYANQLRHARGQLKYTLATLRCLPKLRACNVSGLGDLGTKVSIVAFGNTRYFGGGMAICPAADPTDGSMQVVVVGDVGRLHLAAVLPAAFFGQHVRSGAVHTATMTSAAVTIDAPWWADGERLAVGSTATVSVSPGVLQLACRL
ncbi:MAG: diacylglycerol kinase [Acidimicrobiales bacterium]|nr:diacylglycerol kinase [Acidimicrobiales bacterium]